MPEKPQDQFGEVRYTREIGLRQMASLGLRAILPVMAFLALGPIADASGLRAPLALLLAGLLFLPTFLSYLELAGHSHEGGILGLLAQSRFSLLAFLGGLTLLLIDVIAAGLLAHQVAEIVLAWPAVEGMLASLTEVTPLGGGLTAWVVSGLSLTVALIVAVTRNRPWHRIDDWILVGGLIAVVMTIIAAFSYPARPTTLEAADFEGILEGVVPAALMILAVEAMGEWKREMRRPERTLPWVTLAGLAILIVGSLALTLSALRVDGDLFAAEGLAPILSELRLPFAPAVTSALFIVTLVVAAGALLLQASRLLRQMVREGFFPRVTLSGRRTRTVVSILVLALLSGAALILPSARAFNLLQLLVMLLAVVINLTAIINRPRDEDRVPNALILPYPPLIPATGLGIVIFLFAIVRWTVLPEIAVILGVALLIYLAYGQAAHREIQQTRTVFKRDRRADQVDPDRFRILVPLLDTPAEQRALVALASALAAQEGGEVLPVQVITLPPQYTRAEGERMARERNQLLQWSFGQSEGEVPVVPMTRIGRDPVSAIIDTAREQFCDLILVTWRPSPGDGAPQSERNSLVARVVRSASCMVAALDGDLSAPVKRILVPTAGGPHAPVAASLALSLAQHWDAEVVGLYIVRDDGDQEATAQAEELVRSTFADLPGGENITVRLITGRKSIAATLAEEADNYDMVLLGASNERLLDKVLFGNIPQQVAEATETPAIMVRAAQPPRQALLRTVWDRLQSILPTLSQREQADVYRDLWRGARPDVDYFVLIVLSAVIATLGLWQNSGAVIIGAMLVAPLMTPILANSMGVVMGNARMIRLAAEATIKGVVSGIAIAAFLTLILPPLPVGSEIIARTNPTTLDLLVALASGAAGAYALARKDVSAALPGVAIAAALMPPLCTVGIGLAIYSPRVAGGALLLFITNLVAITVAGALVFLLMGMRPRHVEERETRFRRGLVLAMILLLIISVPLTWLGVQNSRQERVENEVRTWLPAAVRATGDAELLEWRVTRSGQTLEVYARVQTAQENLPPSTVEAWSNFLARQTERTVHLTVDVQPVVTIDFTTAPP